MSLTRIKILQVGDLHLPLVIREDRNLDDKDPSFSTDLRNKISSSPTKIVYRKLYDLVSDGDCDALLFMGDLTDKGDLVGFSSAARYLAHALQIGVGRRNSSIPVGIVPGNHDINRDLALHPSMLEKFRPLNEELSQNGLPEMPVDEEKEIPLSRNEATAKLVLVNSCWGCGSKEFIPELFRDIVHDAIQGILGDAGSKEHAQYYDRQLDTPAFSTTSIDRIAQARNSTPTDTVEVYVAHHNLLPQRTTRLAPYTELVNSGAFRSCVADGSKPTIYLHGHIHEDPVEIISKPGGASLISVSAPMSSSGFNELDILFTSTGLPLACQIRPWRFSPSGVLERQEKQSIPLLSGRRRARDASLPKLLSFILARREVYWSEIWSHNPTFFEDQTEAMLQEGLEMLMADQTVTVENYDMKPRNWIVRSNL